MSEHSHGRVVRNIVWLLLSQAGTWTITLVLTFIVPPYLGVGTYGLYAFTNTYAGFFALGISLGMGTYLTWRIAREPGQASRLTFNALVLQIPLGLFWGILGVFIFTRMDSRPVALQLVDVMMVTTILATLASTCIAALGGLQIMRAPAFIQLGAASLGTVLIVLATHLHGTVVTIALCGLFTQGLGVLGILVYTHRKIHLHVRLDLRLWPKLIAGGLPFFTWSIVLLFYWQIDVLQLKAMIGDAVVGWYTVANRVIGIPVFLPNIVVTAILPALSRERNSDSPAFRAIASRAIRLVVLINVPACVGTIMLSSGFVGLLHYPKTFTQIGPLIAILAVNMPLVALDMVLGTVLIALGKQKSWTVVGIIAGITNPLVNLWAIPLTQHLFGDGAIGASVTTVQSELIMFVGAMILRPKNIFNGWDVWYIFRCLLAAGIMIPAVWGLSTQAGVGILPAVCYGVVVYALAVYAFQVVRNSDFLALLRLIGGRLGISNDAQLDWDALRDRLGVNGRVASTRAALKRAQTAISRPLGAVSRPLARAGGAVSQPLASATQTLVGVFREQYYASPVSQYIHKAGELFSQEEIAEATDPALAVVAPDGLAAPAARASDAEQHTVTEEVAAMPPQPVAQTPFVPRDTNTTGNRGGGGSTERRQYMSPRRSGKSGHKDPRTMQRGETEPLPSLEEVQNRAVPATTRAT